MTSSGSKKITIGATGLAALAAVDFPSVGESITAFCIKVVAITAITLAVICWQAWLDNKPKTV